MSCQKQGEKYSSKTFKQLYKKQATVINIYCWCTNYENNKSNCLTPIPVSSSSIMIDDYKVLTSKDNEYVTFIKEFYKPYLHEEFINTNSNGMISTNMVIELLYKDGCDTLSFIDEHFIQLNNSSLLEYDFNIKKVFQTIKIEKPCIINRELK